MPMWLDAGKYAVAEIPRIIILNELSYRKCASVISAGPCFSCTGVPRPDGGKLGVTGVFIPDTSSAKNRTR